MERNNVECQFCQGANARLQSSDPEESIKIERARSGHQVFEKGELIESDIQRASYIFIISEGMAYSFTQLPDGRRQILKYFYPGDLTTVLHPAGNRMRVSVRCLTRVKACRFEAGIIRDALYARRDLLARVAEHAIGQLAEREQLLTDIGACTSEEALARFLLNHFNSVQGGVDDAEVAFPVRLSDIADTIGVTEVHAGRLMRKLEADRLIERRPSSRLFVRAQALARQAVGG